MVLQETKEEEKVDIDLNDPETEKAALKIQAGFKGYQTRKEIAAKKEESQKQTEEEKPAEAEKPAESEQPADSEKPAESKPEDDIDLNDPEVEKAAVKIQAGFKGFKTRQEIKAKQQSEGEGTETKEAEAGESKTEEAPAEGEEAKTEGEAVDIDLNDPEVLQAATKIQAGFKGYKTRQEIKSKKESESEEKKDDE